MTQSAEIRAGIGKMLQVSTPNERVRSAALDAIKALNLVEFNQQVKELAAIGHVERFRPTAIATFADLAPPASDARGDGGSGSGSLSAATLREIAPAVAMLGSRKPQERSTGARTLARIAHDVCYGRNRKLVEFQEAVVAAGGIPLVVRAGGSRRGECCESSLLSCVVQLGVQRCVAAGGIH